MNDCASAGKNQIRGCSLSRAIGAITPQHSQHLIIFVKKSVAIPAQSYFVQPRHSIANHVRYKIASLLTEKVSLSFIAKNCQVSLTTVIRTLKEFKSYLPKQSKRIFPRVLMVDEFRSHASIEDKMSFICADGETGQLIDVLPTRKLPRLTSYFLGCTNLRYLLQEGQLKS